MVACDEQAAVDCACILFTFFLFPPSHPPTPSLLLQLVNLLYAKPYRALELSIWLRAILVCHTAYLTTVSCPPAFVARFMFPTNPTLSVIQSLSSITSHPKSYPFCHPISLLHHIPSQILPFLSSNLSLPSHPTPNPTLSVIQSLSSIASHPCRFHKWWMALMDCTSCWTLGFQRSASSVICKGNLI